MGRSLQSSDRKSIEHRLLRDGWSIVRNGPGDHVQYKHPTQKGRVTIDKGTREIPTGTLRSIFSQAGWEW
jgi:predicted RNA binding protein YcfA (HicA-like mRNA interferase family)